MSLLDFRALFYPNSIAIIGASTKEKSVGNDVVKNLVAQGYQGKIYPVNPKAETIYNLPMFADIEDVPGEIDLVVVAIPAAFVPKALQKAKKKGAKGAIVISAGFKEVGNSELENLLATVCTENEIALIGPNCLGVINPEISMNASFAGIMPRTGNVAFISQSGALCTSILDYARSFNLGFSKFMSIGNKTLIDESTLLEYFASDPKTKVIAMYAEELHDAPRFIEVCKKVTQGENPKPIFILKSGRTSAGAAAIASHTGSLSGGDAAYEALFAQSGVIRVNTIREMIEFLLIFSQNELQDVKNVAVVTNAGGPGVIATDEIVRSGLTLANLSDHTKDKLKSFLPPAASVKNPVDILGDAKADRYQQTLRVLCDDEHSDAALVMLTPQSMTQPIETAQALVEFKKGCHKPVVASFMGQQTVQEAISVLEENSISTTAFPELAARGLGALHRFSSWSRQKSQTPFTPFECQQGKAKNILDSALASNKKHLPEAEALQVLESYGFPTLKRMELRNPKDVNKAQTYFQSEVALKIISPDIVHKSDAEGVSLFVSPSDIETKYVELLERVHTNVPTAKLEGVLAVEMAPKDGIEMILGCNTIPGLGKMLLVGLGGIYVEVFADVSCGYAPISQDYAKKMVEKLHSFAILQGVRGQSGYDISGIYDVIGRLSQLVTDNPQIQELDINPLLVLPNGQGVRVLDARILL